MQQVFIYVRFKHYWDSLSFGDVPMSIILDRKSKDIIFLLFIVLISLAVGWLINVPYTEEIYSFRGSFNPFYFWNLWSYYSLMLFVILFIVLSYVLIVAFKEGFISKKSILYVSVALLVLLLSMVGIVKFLYQGNPSISGYWFNKRKVNQTSMPSSPVYPGGGTQHKINVSRSSSRVLDIDSSMNPFFIVFFILSISFLFLLLFYLKNMGVVVSGSKDVNRIPLYKKEEDNVIEVRRRKTIDLIDVSIEDIMRCEDVKKSIILVYLRMCKMLREHNINVPDNITAREFEEKVFSLLPFMPREYFHKLTLLFEEAKYSDHELSLNHKKYALDLLSKIRSHLVTEYEEK